MTSPQSKIVSLFLPAVRGLKPGTSGCEHRTLPLSYAVPPTKKIDIIYFLIGLPTPSRNVPFNIFLKN